MSYSVGVQNIFELLEDETDDQPEVKTLQTKLEENKTSKPTGPKQPPVGGKPVKGSGVQRDNKQKGADAEAAANKAEGFTEVSTQKNRSSPATRKEGDRPRREGDRKPREPREGGDRKPREPREGGNGDRKPREPREGGDRKPREPREGGDRPPRQPREGRAPREDRGPREDRPPREGKEDRGPLHGQVREDRDKEKYVREHQNAPYDGKKRTYDRKSGTGRNPKENKKGGAGTGNWGSDTNPEEELAAVEQEKAEVKAETEAAAAEDATETSDAAATPAEPKEPEKKEISYADFKKQREQTLSALPTLPAPRQAGEGVNDKEKDKWATEALNRKAEAQAAASAAAKEKAAKKNTVSLDQFFAIKPREQPREDRRRENRDRDGDRPPRPDRSDRSDRPRNDRGPKQGGKGKSEGAKKPTPGSAPPQDADFPTLNTKA